MAFWIHCTSILNLIGRHVQSLHKKRRLFFWSMFSLLSIFIVYRQKWISKANFRYLWHKTNITNIVEQVAIVCWRASKVIMQIIKKLSNCTCGSCREKWGAIHSTKISGNLGSKPGADYCQNSVDRFVPTRRVSKILVHLLRWTTFPGRTGQNFGWMDRTHRHWRSGQIRPIGDHCSLTLFEYEDTSYIYDLSAL